jgi:starch-binding outer membrane protein SusE/F
MTEMKKTYIFLSLILFTFALISCEKDDPKTTITDVTPSVMSNLSSSDFVLTLDDASNEFQTFEWSSADYGFSASVTYVVQFAAKDSNFSNPIVIGSVNHGNSLSISVGDFNKMLLNYGLNPDEATTLQFRVAAVVSANYTPSYSNVLEANVTPYATDFPPIYMCGAATGGWDWAHGVEVRSSAPSVYHTIAYFLNGETFRFFKQADWGPTSYNYPYFDGGFVSDSLENANDGDKNFKFLAPTGYYDITCDLKHKIVTLKPVAEPVMFMTGAALGGWDWSTNYVQMTWVRDGVFEATTDFLNGETFRFFAQKDWSPTSYNYPYFPAGNVDPLFENGNDGDKNFRFIGTTGSYKVTLNMLDNTVVMEAQ